MKATSFISSIIITFFITLTLTMFIDNYGEVNSRGQAMSVLSEYGTVTIAGNVLILSQRGEIQALGLPTDLLQALELLSDNYEIHM